MRRWLPGRALVAVADSSSAVLTLLERCQRLKEPVTLITRLRLLITRLRLDAALDALAPGRTPKQTGHPRKKGERWYSQGERRVEVASGTAVWHHIGLPPVPIRWVLVRDPEGEFAPQTLLCTDLTAEPAQIVSWFVSRWQVETQRQWSERAILHTTPALLGLFWLVTLLAHPHLSESDRSAGPDGPPVRQAAWSQKERPTFSDALALALVRRRLWRQRLGGFCMSDGKGDRQKPPPLWAEQREGGAEGGDALLHHLMDKV